MEIIETRRIDIRARYDLIKERTKGDVYSKIEAAEEVLVGSVVEEQPGVGTLTVLPEYAGKDYIAEDFEQLQPQFADYANFWRERVQAQYAKS